MTEMIFLVVEEPEGTWSARALDHPIFTEANDLASLRESVRDAVRCHFEAASLPETVRLRFVREEVIAM